MKEITKEGMDLLIKKGLIINSKKGFTDKEYNPVGFYRTKNKRYIENKFADFAKRTLCYEVLFDYNKSKI